MEDYKIEKKELDMNQYADEEAKAALVEPTRPTRPTEPEDPPRSPVSFFEMQSVGRVYFNLTKPEPSRWRKMLAKEIDKRPQNMGVWWELWEKHEKELVKLDPWEDDDEDLLEQVREETKKEQKASKKKGNKKGSKKEKSKVIRAILFILT